jgi:hypothetical protein
MDIWNLNGGNYTSSFLIIGVNPYHELVSPGVGNSILLGAGYGLLPYDYLGYASYISLGFNPLAASILLKSLGALAGFLVAGVGYRIAVREGSPHARTIFMALLLNPFFIFVNAIWGETEVLIVLLLLCAVFLLRYGQARETNYPALVLASVALALSAFTYFFTLLLIPALLVYLDGGRRRLTTLALLVAVFGVFAIPYFLFGLASYTSSSLSGAVNGYSILYVFPNSVRLAASTDQQGVLAVVGLLAVLLPILFRRWGISLGTTLLAVTWVAFSCTFFLPGDAFMILAGLVVLAVALGRPRKANYARVLVLQLFLVPIVLIAQMVSGPGQASGIVYWTYFLHHQNITLYNPLGGYPGLQFYVVAYYLGAVADILYFLRADWHAGRAAVGPTVPHPPHPDSTFLRPSPVRLTNALLAGSIAILVVGVPVALALNGPNPPALTMSNEFDSQAFYPYDVAQPNVYPLAAPDTYSVAPLAGTLSIAGPSFPVGFARDTQSQVATFNFSATIEGGAGVGPIPVWKTNNTEVDFAAQPVTGYAVPWTPNSTGGATSTTEVTPVFAGSASVYSLNGIQALVYQIPVTAVQGTAVYFGVELKALSPVHTQLWWIVDGSYQVQAFLADGLLWMGENTGTGWTYTTTPAAPGLGMWFLTGFRVDPSAGTISAFLNGLNLSSPFHLASASNLTVTEGGLGASREANPAYSLTGNLTATYDLPFSTSQPNPAILVWTASGASWVKVGVGTVANITYVATPYGSNLTADRAFFTVDRGDDYVLFGKLGITSSSVDFRFYEISFARSGSGANLVLIVLGFVVLLPAWLISWSGFQLWRSSRVRLNLASQ